MKNNIKYVLLLYISIFTFSCSSGRKINILQENQYQVEYGPEDIILDTVSTTYPRVLLACSNDRIKKGIISNPSGVFWEINLITKKAKPIKTIHHDIAPLGLKLVQKDSKNYLECTATTSRKKHNQIIEYRIFGDSIVYNKTWSDNEKKLGMANNLYPDNKGGLYVSNFLPKYPQRKIFSILYFLYNSGKVLYLSKPENQPNIVLSKLKQPNSFCIHDSYLYGTVTGKKYLYRVKITDVELQQNTFEKIKLGVKINKGDNITLNGDTLITTGYSKGNISFVGKYSAKNRTAISNIYEVKLGEKPFLIRKIVLEDKDNMGLVSVAIKYKSQYFVGQIHDNKILTFNEKNLELIKNKTYRIK